MGVVGLASVSYPFPRRGSVILCHLSNDHSTAMSTSTVHLNWLKNMISTFCNLRLTAV